MKLSTLRKQASSTTVFRGHRMKWGNPFGRANGPMSQHGECRDCGAHCWLAEAPAPNGIDISGLAVAVSCEKPVTRK